MIAGNFFFLFFFPLPSSFSPFLLILGEGEKNIILDGAGWITEHHLKHYCSLIHGSKTTWPMETNYRQEVCLRRKRYWCLKCFLNAYVWIWGGRIKILSLWGNLPIHMVNAGLTPVAECLWTDTHFSVLLFYLTCGFDLHSTVAVILSAVYSTVIYKPGEIILVWGNWKLNKCCRGKAKHLLCWLPWNRLNKGEKKKPIPLFPFQQKNNPQNRKNPNRQNHKMDTAVHTT